MTNRLGVRTRQRLRAMALALAVLPWPVVEVGAAGDSIKLAPHRAVYDVKLSRAAPSSGVSDMSGRFVYELTGGGCEDYTQSSRFVTQSSASDGTTAVNDVRSTTLEGAAGALLRFRSTQYQDDKVGDATEGTATRGKTSGEISIEVVKPKAKALSLPGSTLFPIQHSKMVIEQAKAGKTSFPADIYDGMETGDKVQATMTIIGKGRMPDAAALPTNNAAADKLRTLRYWPISTGFFEKLKTLEQTDALPNYEVAVHLYENGVSTRLVMEYRDFSLKGELTELTFLPEPACATAK